MDFEKFTNSAQNLQGAIMSRKGSFSAFAQAHLESMEGQDWQTENRLFSDVISKVDVAISGFSGPDIMAQLVCAELFPSEKPGMHIECSLGPKVALNCCQPAV